MKTLFAGLLALVTIFGTTQIIAQDTSLYVPKLFIEGNDTLPYRLLLPQNFDSTRKYPVVLFLHGAGERGSDNAAQLTHGSNIFLRPNIRQRYPAIVIFPQCPQDDYWSNVKKTVDEKTGKTNFEFQPDGEPTTAMRLAIDLEKQVLTDYEVDSNKIYVMGLSMGGMGTYEVVRRMPNTFAAAIPICGGADTTTAKDIRKTAFWIFHGTADQVVPVHFSRDMVNALQKFYDTSDMQYLEYPGTGHDSWTKAFAEPDLLRWLFSQRLQR